MDEEQRVYLAGLEKSVAKQTERMSSFTVRLLFQSV